MDESDHLTLVNAGDEEVVSQEEGGREGYAAGGEEGGCCCASAIMIAIAHMRAVLPCRYALILWDVRGDR